MRVHVVLGLCSVLSLAACEGKPGSSGGSTSGASATPQTKHVSVVVGDDGFTPSEVKVGKGEPLMLMFRRTTETTCAKAVEFPELKIKKDLPLNQDVSIDVPTSESRTLTFQCGLGMFKSKVIIQ